MVQDKIEELENRIKALEDKRNKDKIIKREPSAYNLFVKGEIAKIKRDMGDKYDHKVAFAEAAKRWRDVNKS